MSVTWVWSGAVTPSSVRVRTQTTGSSTRLARSTSSTLTNAVYTPAVTPVAGISTFDVTGLSPSTTYYYAVEDDGVLDTVKLGQFTTHATVGTPMSFKFAAWSCHGSSTATYPGTVSRTSNTPVFDTVRSKNPLFNLQMGDMHYRDSNTTDVGARRQIFGFVNAQTRWAALMQSAPLVYTWDDHDFCGDASGAFSAGAAVAKQVFMEQVPHPPLANSDDGIYHAFTVGRVRFIMSDSRYNRVDSLEPDGPDKYVYSAAQEAWLLDELTTRTEPLLIWVNASPWITPVYSPGAFSDRWGGYATQRQRIGDAIEAAGVGNKIVMLSGDMHALAIDSGINNQHGGFPVFHFAAMDVAGSIKGGPYSEGVSDGGSRYGIVEILDDGQQITLTGTGYIDQDVWKSLTITFDAPPATPSEDPYLLRHEGTERRFSLFANGAKRRFTVRLP